MVNAIDSVPGQARNVDTDRLDEVPLDRVRQRKELATVSASVILIGHGSDHMLGTRYTLTPGGTLTIGRLPTTEIRLADEVSVSREHARLRHDEGRVWLEDLGSTNGTFLNECRISDPVELESGGRFRVGRVYFKFLHDPDVEMAYHEAIHKLVVTDGLTEAFNRRKFDAEIEREFARARRYSRPLSLVLIDLDHFKDVNDRFGHLSGDVVLARVSGVIREQVRNEDLVARIGGDEFAVICTETSLDKAMAMAGRLREAISADVIRAPGGDRLPVTCSFGVAGMLDSMGKPSELYEAADRALYVGKNEGRDRVSIMAGADELLNPVTVGTDPGTDPCV